MVTSSVVDSQAYKEIRLDRHPIIVINGKDSATILIRKGINAIDSIRNWMKSVDQDRLVQVQKFSPLAPVSGYKTIVVFGEHANQPRNSRSPSLPGQDFEESGALHCVRLQHPNHCQTIPLF